MNCVRTSQTMASHPIVDTEAAAVDHGETDDKPMPAPSARRMSESAAAAKAPPATAPHDTPDEYASFVPDRSTRSARAWADDGERIGCSMPPVRASCAPPDLFPPGAEAVCGTSH